MYLLFDIDFPHVVHRGVLQAHHIGSSGQVFHHPFAAGLHLQFLQEFPVRAGDEYGASLAALVADG